MVKDNDFIEFECPVCLGIVRLARDQITPQVTCPDCESTVDVPPEYLTETELDENPLDLFADLDVDALAMPDESGLTETAAGAAGGTAQTSENSAVPVDVESPRKGPSQASVPPVSEATGDADDIEMSAVGAVGTSAENAPSGAGLPTNEPDELLEELDDDDLVPLADEELDDSDSSDEPLRVEGLTEDEPLDDVFGIRCHICDTRIHVDRSKIGEYVECPICFTQVKVTPPVDRPKPLNPWSAPSRSPEPGGIAGTVGADSEELRLADADDETKFIEPGYGLEPVEDDLLKPLEPEQDESAEADRAARGSSAGPPTATDDDADEFRLAPPVETPRAKPVHGSIASIEPPGSPSSPSNRPTQPPRPDRPTRPAYDSANVGGAPRSGLVELDDEEEEEDDWVDFEVPEPLTLRAVFQWLRLVGANAEFLIRSGMSVALFAVAYSFSESFFELWDSTDVEGFGKGLGLAVRGGLGGFAWLVGAVGLAIIFGVVFRDSAESRKLKQWPGMALSEWLGPFFFVAFSMWVASLPGLIVGNILAAATDSLAWIVFLTPISIFLLMPICIVSAMFNDSVMNVVSFEVLKSLRSQWPRWQRFYVITVALLTVYLVGTAILFLPTFFFSILGAVVQVFAVVAMAAASGLHARAVIDEIMEQA